MLLEEQNNGGGHDGPWCRACRQPILDGQRITEIRFNTDPHGFNGQTGPYHVECSRPFASMAHIINLNPFGGR